MYLFCYLPGSVTTTTTTAVALAIVLLVYRLSSRLVECLECLVRTVQI